ncbi:AMP-binding protein [Auriscalpium vulgare]|uniref:AMP-binding protein n=1 Tax=Auriscalpium vulgare TaxID=40419 RepID=A0ACB8S793_9AGAM|nr:AMP-binding protein [Auriscalpium vulgare]
MLFSHNELQGLLQVFTLASSHWTSLFRPFLDFLLNPKFSGHAIAAKVVVEARVQPTTSRALVPPSFNAVPTPHPLIHSAFLAHAYAMPDQLAAQHLDESITYGELEAASGRVCAYLRARGVARGHRVCLVIRRSLPMLAGILGVLRAGASYVPLDGDIITESTLGAVLQDAQPTIILTSKMFEGRVACVPTPSASLEDIISMDTEGPDLYDDFEVQTSDAAYIIFTSGTTGRPKGVVVTHQNVTNLLCLSPGNMGIRPGIHVAQLLNVAFDMCAWEILGCLANGGTLHLRGQRRHHWVSVLKAVDVVICTPSILVPHDPADYPNIKFVATAGEPCPQWLADKWAVDAVFYNCCGPTEVTIVNTMHRHIAHQPLTIGRPTPNNTVYVLDEDLRPVPAGATGVMWAGGLGISQGYLNRPDLNATRYRPDPFCSVGGVMFNTGDLGRWTKDGELDHLGRVDDQVKIKGFRVELDGVTAAMSRAADVQCTSAILVDGNLWGFYCPESVPGERVKASVEAVQPYYAVPTKFIALPALPVTSNGKIDKRKLLSIAETLETSSP